MTDAPKNSNRFAKGNPGKPKGAVTKVTADVKAMVLAALTKVGGVDYLMTQATENPKAFLSLLGRIIPVQVTGEDGTALVVKVIGLTTADEQAKAKSA